MPDPDDFTGVWMCEVTRTSIKTVFVREGEHDLCELAVTYALLADDEEWDTSDAVCETRTELTFRQLKQLYKHPETPEVIND